MDPNLSLHLLCSPKHCETDTTFEPSEDGTYKTTKLQKLWDIRPMLGTSKKNGAYISSAVINLCTDLLTRFNTFVQPDEFLTKEIERFQLIYDEYEIYVMVEIFFGVLDRIACIIQVVVSFRESSLSQGTLDTWDEEVTCHLEVLTYIICFAAKDICSQSLHEIFVSFDWEGAKPFYRFVVASGYMQSNMMRSVLEVYAPEYVEEKIFPNVRSSLTTLRAAYCSRRSSSPPESVAPRATVVQPFKFSKIRPRLPTSPEPKPPPFRASVVPQSTFIHPQPSEQLEEDYDRHRNHGQKNFITLLHLERKSRLYHEEDKSYRFYRKISSIKLERLKEVERTRYTGPRIPLEKTFQVPAMKPAWTYTELLRQKQICFHQKQMELQALEDLAVGGNLIDFKSRDLEMQREDKRQHVKDLERKQMEAKLAFQKAIAARRQLQEDKREQASEFKEEINKLFEDNLNWERSEEAKLSKMKEKTLKEQEMLRYKESRKAKREKAEKDSKNKMKTQERLEMLKQRNADRAVQSEKRVESVQKARAARMKPKSGYGSFNERNICARDAARVSIVENFMRSQRNREDAQAELNLTKYKIYLTNREAAERKTLIELDLEQCYREKKKEKLRIEAFEAKCAASYNKAVESDMSNPALDPLNSLRVELANLTFENMSRKQLQN